MTQCSKPQTPWADCAAALIRVHGYVNPRLTGIHPTHLELPGYLARLGRKRSRKREKETNSNREARNKRANEYEQVCLHTGWTIPKGLTENSRGEEKEEEEEE